MKTPKQIDKSARQGIIQKSKVFFKKKIALNHIKNTKKLIKLNAFKVNPFLIKYLANFLGGNVSSENIAKALIYPRILGTSITTSFGSNFQHFCVDTLRDFGFASPIPGVDIEFFDQIDGRKKYCQLKAGPETINKDDITTISDHFKKTRNIARTNHLNIGVDDMIVGILYGMPSELSSFYKTLNKEHPVYIGQDFWERLTGDKDFYKNLINAFGEIALETKSSTLLKNVIKELAKDIEANLKL
jgi:hypothetical protein